MWIRDKCRSFQAKYEKILAGKSVFGFSKLYTDAMQQINERNEKKKHSKGEA